VKLTTHLHLVPRSRMRGAIPSLPQCAFIEWCLSKRYVFMARRLVKDGETFTSFTCTFKFFAHVLLSIRHSTSLHNSSSPVQAMTQLQLLHCLHVNGACALTCRLAGIFQQRFSSALRYLAMSIMHNLLHKARAEKPGVYSDILYLTSLSTMPRRRIGE
jgi:hypothetical protein